MKTIIFNALSTDATLKTYIPTARWFAVGNVEEHPTRPFAVIRWTGSAQGIPQANHGPEGVQIWVHDEPGSYDSIDAVIKRIKVVLSGILGVTSGTEHVACSRWEADSGELSDAERGTIVRNTQWRVVGRE